MADTLIPSGDLRYNDAPLSASTTDNWVARRGGLPPMVRAIARALMRNGHSESGAISLAIGAVKRWARGGGNVHPSTRARAAAAVAHWEAIKASTGRSDEELARAQAGPAGSADQKASQKASTAKSGGSGAQGPAKGAYAAGHPFYGNQHAKVAGQQGIDVGGKGGSTKAIPKGAGGGGKGGGKGGGSSAAQTAAAKAANAAKAAFSAAAAKDAKVTAATTARDNAKTAVDAAQKHHDQATQQLADAQKQAKIDVDFAKAKEVNTPKGVQGSQAVDAVTAAVATHVESAQNNLDNAAQTLSAAQQRLNQSQAALDAAQRGIEGHEIILRDAFVGETTADNSKLFLPAGPTKKEAKKVTDTMGKGEAAARHRFEGGDLSACARCGEPLTASVHTGQPGQPIPPVPRQARSATQDNDAYHEGIADRLANKPKKTASQYADLHPEADADDYPLYEAGFVADRNDLVLVPKSVVRHAGPGHHSVPSGHIKGVPARHAKAAANQAAQHMSAVEGPLENSMKSLFSLQRKETLARLEGKRGKQMLKRAGGPNEPPEIPPEDSGTVPPEAPAIIGPGAIFDSGFWGAKTADVLSGHLQTAGNLAAGAVRDQVRLDPMHDDSTSLGALNDVIAARAQAAADYISGTTSKALTGALQEGVANGEGIPAIAKRVNEVFDNADIVRAKRIAQTEVVGAYNEGALAYASGLPSDVIGTRRWLSHHDDRTRPTHRLADGQEQPMGAPFYVGGSPMMAPGDKSAPVGEWINCRCVGEDNLIAAADVSMAFRREYEGDLVEIATAGGHHADVTPNHPILTDAGWRMAGDLREGDYVISGSPSQRMTWGNPDVDHVPSPAREVFDAVAFSALLSQRVAAGPMDFHGDGTEGQVDVVLANPYLSSSHDPAGFQKLLHFAVALSHRQMGVPGDRTSRVGIGDPQYVGPRTVAGFHPGFDQSPTNGWTRDAVSERQCLLRLASGVAVDHVSGHFDSAMPLGGSDRFSERPGYPQAAEFGAQTLRPNMGGASSEHEGSPFAVEPDRVVKISRRRLSGHVYNFTTATGRYTTNGIVTHNCSVAYMPPGMAYNGIAAAAQAYVAGLKAKPPVPSSPYEVAGVEP